MSFLGQYGDKETKNPDIWGGGRYPELNPVPGRRLAEEHCGGTTDLLMTFSRGSAVRPHKGSSILATMAF